VLGFAQQEGREGVEYLEVLVAGEGSEEDLAKGMMETCAPGVSGGSGGRPGVADCRESEREDNGRGENTRQLGKGEGPQI
jgi:hypothetical protein